MRNDDLSENIKQIFSGLIQGTRSRDESVLWANSVLEKDKMSNLSSAFVDALEAIGMAALKGGPEEDYLFDEDDFRKWMEEFLSKECED